MEGRDAGSIAKPQHLDFSLEFSLGTPIPILLTNSLCDLIFSFYLPSPAECCETTAGTLGLPCSQPQPQHPEQCLAESRYSRNICSMSK